MTAQPDTAPTGRLGAQRPDPLAAVRAALLARAAADAQRALDSADREVANRLADARSHVAGLLTSTSAAADADVAAIAEEARARARRQERAIVLAAQQSAFERLRSQSHLAVRGLRADPAYPTLLERLTAAARHHLGSGAVVREHPDGGVLAETAGRRLSLSLDAAADRALDAMGARVEELWRP